MVDALADIFTMADAWIVDGILAKLSAALVGFVGTVLRAFQTGRVQAYSAMMVLGLAGIGVYTALPHAGATVDDANLRQNGQVVIKAAPGPGYSYKWAGPGLPTGNDFSTTRQIQLELKPGERKDVVLTVKNAFRVEATETISVSRPGRPAAAATAVPGQAVPMRPVGTDTPRVRPLPQPGEARPQ